jgi:pullulanase
MTLNPWRSLRLPLILCFLYLFAGAYSPDSQAAESGIWWRSHRFLVPAHQGLDRTKPLQLRFQARGSEDTVTYPLRYEGLLKDIEKKPGRYGQYLSFALAKTPANATDQWLKQRITEAATLRIGESSENSKTLSLQIAPMLDREFRPTQTLGVSYPPQNEGKKRPLLSVWAPTATTVKVIVKDPQGKPPAEATQIITQALTSKSKGVWEVLGPEGWDRAYYQLEIDVYQPLTQTFQTYRVTDPYAVSLSTNSEWSQFVDLRDADLKPAQWESPEKAYKNPEAPEDWVLYELHVRDFSQKDLKVPAAHRGKYTAFSQPGAGQAHLQKLARSGVTHIHLLPVFDIATIPETDQQTPVINPVGAPTPAPNSPDPQAAIGKVRAQDGFNWGYDPLHYGVPEGSYSTEPEGVPRIREFREMVKALEKMDLGVVMDVVYNHTHAAGEAPQSLLDKIVPGYYYRLDAQGKVQQTSCCPDTASEHAMMEHLMIQTLVRWAKAYHVQGFRFDLMGHHTRENLLHIRQALDQLTLAKDGINGHSIYLYGEGWKFGSLEAVDSASAMHQANAAGTGVGTFNDRMRDSLRGGNFDHNTRSDQGWINGLFLNPNQSPWNTDTPSSAEGQAQQLQNYTQLVRLSMAGNLAEFTLGGVKGKNLKYRGQTPAGYTQDPQENVNYVSAHDNYTLWDQIAAKAPLKTPALTRARMQQLGMAAVILGQGVPFLHAGSEILRSKSGDGDSYDSGDWFNALDWTYTDNGWGKGLPAAWRNEKEWPFWSPLLLQPQLKPTPSEISSHLNTVESLLRIRKASPLFRLRTAEAIQKQVRFLNAEAGKAQIPGLIVMHIQATPAQDPLRQAVMVILNANPGEVKWRHPLLNNRWQGFTLDDGSQPIAHFSKNAIPGYGIAVLELPR